MKMLLVLLGLGYWRINDIIEKKQKHTWAFQVMEELVSHASNWEYGNDGRNPLLTAQEEATPIIPHIKPDEDPSHTSQSPSPTPENASMKEKDGGTKETPILLAAKMGVAEVVEKILEVFPIAVHDMNDEKKNIVLLAAENRQPHVYQLLLKKKLLQETVFNKVDHEGNSALHLAATMTQNRPWLIPGAALQMQWEIKWFKFVQDSMPRHFFLQHNNNGKTPTETFTETHKKLIKQGGNWLTNTSQSCSVVAALIATVAFATATALPGGVNQENGSPTLEGKPAFEVFAISSLIALCLSVTSLIMFLAILTSRYQERDFARDLPVKLIIGLTSLFISIASMLVSFCAGHFFVLKDKLKYASYPLYGLTCLPVTFFALAQFPLYIDLLRSIIKHVPQRTYKILSF
ncbi:ankyrin repeat-containing protein ITN1-like [Magnolia sinica]|uniref:ankyrin repeat-containing protein ITN1-like n=1 Tax=Magnolia sinica TaxID=86752 RepID=UPI00265B4A9A|nr:ankyrin repeat-containing protein ITN1-like [Magnolia sinica]